VRQTLAFAVLFSLFSIQLLAQDSVTVIPGPEYEAGWLHRMVFGPAWRDLWTTPIKVELLDLASFAGGLRATERGGGFQTKSLRFRGNNGKEYKFRSINKDPRLILPAALRQSLVGDIVQDFIATSNPVSGLVASPLLDAAGVLNSSYRLVQLPDDARLGEFRDEFKELVGMLEENPQADDEGESFADADKIISTNKLFKRLEEDNDESVDAREYLRARLMDVFMGDWDRHVDQWRWAGYKSGKQWIWQPIPRDRDQAFCRYNGIVGWTVAQQVQQIESCSDSYPWISDLTWSGRHTDRRFLSILEKSAWDSVTNAIHESLTDDVIESAVRELPLEMYEKEGANLVRTLKARRDKFKEASQEYYENLARFVDVWASDKNEYADVERIGNDSVIVSLFKRDKETGGAKGDPFFQRTFDRRETREIRLYLQGGEDFTVVRGNAVGSIPVRIIGGKGEDELADSSQVRGSLLGFIPIRTSKVATYFYETDRKAEFVYGSSTSVDQDDFERPEEDSLKYEPLYRDWGHEWKGYPWLGANTDDGVFVGAIARLTNYQFRSIPYHDRVTFKAGYAFGANRFRAIYDHEFPNVFSGTLNLFARASGLEVLNFFGFGNNTSFDKKLSENDIYKVKQQQYVLLPSYSISPVKNVTISGHAGVRLFKTDLSDLVDSAVLRLTRPYGIDDALFSSIGINGTYDSRDNAIAPQEGVYFTIGNFWNPEVFDNVYAYTKGYSEFRGYYTAPALGGITLAVRARGEKIFGNRFPFYDAAFLGGISDLRGYSRERFAGDAAVLATAELRINIGNFFILVPGMYGIHGFAEEGRVFYDGETSEARHGSFGGGIWFAPLGIENTVAFTIAKSPEQTTFAVTGGFAF